MSAFAAAALAAGTVASADRLAVGQRISDSLAPMLSAIAGAGLIASVVVFFCLVMNDARRRVGTWLVAQRHYVLVPLRAITWVIARSSLATVLAMQVVVVEAIWLARTVGKALGWVLACAVVVGFVGLIYVGIIVIGLGCVSLSTRIVVAIVDDPPRQLAMALGIGAATALMYAALGAFALSVWLANRVTRAALQGAERAKMALWGS